MADLDNALISQEDSSLGKLGAGVVDWWKRGGLANSLGLPEAMEQIARADPQGDGTMRSMISENWQSNPALSVLSPGSINAWHGTPHTFEPVEHNPFGEFRDEAIGSGEGAQAYGYGHYVAGNPKVAEDYQEALAGSRPVPADENGNALGNLEMLKKFYEPGTIVPGNGGTFDKVLKFNSGDDGKWNVRVQEVVPKEGAKFANLGEALQNPDIWEPSRAYGAPRIHASFPTDKELADVGNLRGWQMTKPGHLLEVHVLPDENELLDWDKPLGEQSAAVQNTIKQMPRVNFNSSSTGNDLYKYISKQAGNDALASQALHEAGIPGLKYLDAGSRSSGEGTHNYVIFHPSNLRIVGRDGQKLEPVDYDPFAGGGQ